MPCNNGPTVTALINSAVTCSQGPMVTATIEGEPVLPDVPCLCEPDVTPLHTDDCIKLGETHKFVVRGCGCSGLCGGVEAVYLSGKNMKKAGQLFVAQEFVTLGGVTTTETVVTFGPFTDFDDYKYQFVCAEVAS